MAQSGCLAMLIIAVVLGIAFEQSRADISCYVCSSDTSTGAFCNDPFDANAIPPESKRWAYAQCARPSEFILQNGARPVCQKVKDRVGDRVVIRRRCAIMNANAAKDSCMNEQVSQSIQREFCEFCDTDGCNGASAYGPAALLIALSAAVTKLLFL